MRGHQYHRRMYLFVRWAPKCPSIVCAWSTIWVIVSRLRGIHITSSECWLFRQMRSFLMVKPVYSVGLSRISVNNLSSLYPDWIWLRNSSFPQVIGVALEVRSNSASAKVRSSPYAEGVDSSDSLSDMDGASAAFDALSITRWLASSMSLASNSRSSCCSCNRLL